MIEYVLTLKLDEKFGLAISETRNVALGTKTDTFKVYDYDLEDKPIKSLTVSIKQLKDLLKQKIYHFYVGESVMDIRVLMELPLKYYNIDLYYEGYPIIIKYSSSSYFSLPLHNCDENCTHEVANIKGFTSKNLLEC